MQRPCDNDKSPGVLQISKDRALVSRMAQTLTNVPAIQETGSIPGSEDPLEEEMATHSSILAWRIPWTEEPGRLQSMG